MITARNIFILFGFLFVLNSWGQFGSAKPNLNLALVKCLDSIHSRDQQYRALIWYNTTHYGPDAPETTDLKKIVRRDDSVNLIVVKEILDKYGWLGPETIGLPGNNTLYLVLEHSDLANQEKYLPMLRKAVKDGKGLPEHLASLEDVVLLRQGKEQKYGSEVATDRSTDPATYYVRPLGDPKNVDKRRKKLGLQMTMAEYTARWGIVWDAKQYKKDLPKIIEIEKRNMRRLSGKNRLIFYKSCV